MKVTLRQMQVFDAVATAGSVTKAADNLRMSQSAVSSALSEFQAILQRPLFAHSRGRSLQITDEGKRLHPAIRSILEESRELEMSHDNEPVAGRLVIGATSMIAEMSLPRLSVEFMKVYPDVQIKIEVEPVKTLIDQLARLELEIALIEAVPDLAGIELIRWQTDEMVLVVESAHPLAERGKLQIKDLAGYSWCTREGNSSTMARLRYMLYEEIGTIPVAFETVSNWAVRNAVLAGGGIGCLSRSLVEFDLEIGRLCQLDVENFSFNRPLCIARPQNIWRGKLHRTFDAFLMERGDLSSSNQSV